jgi:hypothetical protein
MCIFEEFFAIEFQSSIEHANFFIDCEHSLYFPGLRLNARENGKKGRRREEK